MSIKKILNLFLFSSILLLFNSCAQLPIVSNSFTWPVDSFVKYETALYRQVCTPEDPDLMSSHCYVRVSGAVGSGSIVAKSFDGAYILTAAHVCDKSGEIERIKKIDKEFGIDANPKYIDRQFVYDIDLFKYKVEIVGYDWELDSCVVFAWGLFNQPLQISNKPPKIGDKVFNIAAPSGFMTKDMVPLFDGYYIGNFDSTTAVYTIPVIGGSSGSPVLDSRGHLIGLIYARHTNFHHIAISPKYKNLIKFMFDNIKEHARKKAKKHEIDSDRSIIFKFNEKQ